MKVDIMVQYIGDKKPIKRCEINVTKKRFEEIKRTCASLETYILDFNENCGGYIP